MHDNNNDQRPRKTFRCSCGQNIPKSIVDEVLAERGERTPSAAPVEILVPKAKIVPEGDSAQTRAIPAPAFDSEWNDAPRSMTRTTERECAEYWFQRGVRAGRVTEQEDARRAQITAETERGWTKGLPTADGDYFSRIDEHDKSPTLIRIEANALYEMGQGGNLRREYAAEDYEYLGPISPSDTEQLIRLRRAVQAADQWFDKYFAEIPCSIPIGPVTALLREALQVKAEMKGEQL